MANIPTVKYYEVEFEDGRSVAIKGLARPTLEAAERFCKMPQCGKVVAVYDLTRKEVETFFDTTGIEYWRVFGF